MLGESDRRGGEGGRELDAIVAETRGRETGHSQRDVVDNDRRG